MTDRFLFGIIIDDTIIENNKVKWREKDRKKIKGLVSGSNLPHHAQRSEKKTNAYCLMTNHVHLLLEIGYIEIGKFMII